MRASHNPRILIGGARCHNLDSVDLEIPLGRFVVITGPSGSGKSTLAMEVLLAEAQFRYLESAGAGLNGGGAAQCDYVEGLPPAVGLGQIPPAQLGRSSVAVALGIGPPFKALFARYGRLLSPCCGMEVRAWSLDEMAAALLSHDQGTRLVITAPVEHLLSSYRWPELLEMFRSQGFLRMVVDGEVRSLDELREDVASDDHGAHGALGVVVDRVKVRSGVRPRLMDSLRLALRLGGGVVRVHVGSSSALTFTDESICPSCRTSYSELTPSLFTSLLNPGAATGGEVEQLYGSVSLDGRSIVEVASMPLEEFSAWLRGFLDRRPDDPVAATLHRVLSVRLEPALRLGLGYLSVNRALDTISAGELQLLRIGSVLARPMPGVLYVLDEPSCGLGAEEVGLVVDILQELVEQGCSVVVVDHNLDVIRRADHVIELGPGSGRLGGRVVFQGGPEALEREGHTSTGPYLASSPARLRRIEAVSGSTPFVELGRMDGSWPGLQGARFPLERLTVVSGPVGSGKTSLVMELLPQWLAGSRPDLSVWTVDQHPIRGRGTAVVASFCGVLSIIRSLFARLPLSRQRGYTASTFSLAKKGGRCQHCKGKGYLDQRIPGLPLIRQPCPVCRGRRFQSDLLDVRYKGYSMADLLETTVDDALELFKAVPELRRRLQRLGEFRLGYLTLGQPLETLSGGEAQRLKLATRLMAQAASSVIIMDEPTRGLHPSDVEVLVGVMDSLVDHGHTVVVASNNEFLIRNADWRIELGPGMGPAGGRVVSQGAAG